MENMKVYFEKSKQILSFIKKCGTIPEENNPLYDDIIESLLAEADLLPMLNDLEIEYFEHANKMGRRNSYKYIVGLWSNSVPAPSLEYLYVLDNRLRAIGLIWAKFIHDMEQFFDRIGATEIDLYKKDIVKECLVKYSSLENQTPDEVVAANFDKKISEDQTSQLSEESEYTPLNAYLKGGLENIKHMMMYKQPRNNVKLRWDSEKGDALLFKDILNWSIPEINRCIEFKGGVKLTAGNRKKNGENNHLTKILQSLK